MNIDPLGLCGLVRSGKLRAQLGLAVRALLVLGCTIGLLPLVFWLWPGLAGIHLGPVGLGWLLLGVVVYPVLAPLLARVRPRDPLNVPELSRGTAQPGETTT